MVTHEKRFAGRAGKLYRLYSQACPHEKSMQQRVAGILAGDAQGKSSYRILEIGVGSGNTAEALLETIGDCQVTGLDNEEVMLAQAQERFGDAYQERLVLQNSDALGFLTAYDAGRLGSYDAVVSAWTFHNWEGGYRRACLRAIIGKGVLRKGGLLALVEKIALKDPREHAEKIDARLGRMLALGQEYGEPEWALEWIRHYAEDERPGVRWEEQALRRDLLDAGFEDPVLYGREELESLYVARRGEG